MSSRPPRIHMSVPHMGPNEERFVREAFATNWLSTVGPHLTAFESEFRAKQGMHSVALGSGTAAIHLGLRLLGVGPGDEVISPSLTFVASVNPIRYLGAKPMFVDSDESTWNLDPQRLADALTERAKVNRLPKAVMVVHLYGQCADMDALQSICARYDVPIIEDAAEALGAFYKGKPAGSFADVSAFSFNGNKIITTTGGGMLSTTNKDWADRARFWSTQARDPGVAYEHTDLGYNYRLSNVLAGIGRGQLMVLEERVAQRRAVFSRYAKAFDEVPGINAMPEASFGTSTRWLSVFLIEAARSHASRDDVLTALERENIEARPVWKPMHLQPLNNDCEWLGGDVAEKLFRDGICLPSSSSLSEEDQGRVINVIRSTLLQKPAMAFSAA